MFVAVFVKTARCRSLKERGEEGGREGGSSGGGGLMRRPRASSFARGMGRWRRGEAVGSKGGSGEGLIYNRLS